MSVPSQDGSDRNIEEGFVLDADFLTTSVNTGLLPLFAVLYSVLNSWHCAVMCGPLMAASRQKESLNRMLLFRGLSYALMGGFLGYGGQRLKESLEIRAVGGLSLVVFSVISLLCILPLLFPPLRKFSPLSALSRFRGLIWGLMPCHLLLFYYGISVLTASAWTGAGVLMIHAVMTTPALLFANRFIQKTELLGPRVAKIVKYTLVFMVILSLTSFWWALLQASPVGKENPWLCF